MPRTIKEHIKKAGRQSTNITDLRDKPVGPKGYLRKTVAARKQNTKGKLDQSVRFNSSQTENKSLSKIKGTQNTQLRNMMVNNIRGLKLGFRLGVSLKNKKLDAPKQSFKKAKK